MNCRVDTVPPGLKLPLDLYGYSVGGVWRGYDKLVHWTSQIVSEGEVPPAGTPHILCMWHSAYPLYFAAIQSHVRHAWINHPAWYMKPIHLKMAWVGIEKIVLGSTGHGGRRAADDLVTYLNKGYSTCIFPDGPAGPRGVLKKGVLHIAAQSGLPIVPVRMQGTRVFRLPTWDRKRVPLPGGTILLDYQAPIYVNAHHLEAAHDRLRGALGLP